MPLALKRCFTINASNDEMKQRHKLPKIEFAIFHRGNWFDQPVNADLDFIPRPGDKISIESFFPKFITDDWEREFGIYPYGEVYEVVISANKVEVNIKAGWNE